MDVSRSTSAPSPRFARAYELLKRREEMKQLPDPFPPLETAKPTFLASAFREVDDAPPLPRESAPPTATAMSVGVQAKADLEEVAPSDADYDSDLTSASPRSSQSSGFRPMHKLRTSSEPRPREHDTALSRLAMDEGLSGSEWSAPRGNRNRNSKRQHHGHARGVSPRPGSPRSTSASDVTTGSDSVPGPPHRFSSPAWKPPTASVDDKMSTVRDRLEVYRQTKASLLKRSPPQRQAPQTAVARELDDMHRRHQAALGEIARLREINDTSQGTTPRSSHNPLRKPPAEKATELKLAATTTTAPPPLGNLEPRSRLVKSVAHVTPRYRDPAVRHRSPLDKPDMYSPPRKPQLPAAARGAPISKRELASVAVAVAAAATSTSERGAEMKTPPLTSGHSKSTSRTQSPPASLRRESTSPQRPRDPNYTVAKYDYSHRLLSAHAAQRKKRLEEIKAASVHVSSSVFATPATHQGQPSVVPSTVASRSASAASTSVSGVKKPPRVWSPTTTRVERPLAVATQVTAVPNPAAASSAPSVRPVSHESKIPSSKNNQHVVVTKAWNGLPLPDYIKSLLTQPLHRLRHELQSGVDHEQPASWVALTALLNHPSVLGAVVVPMLLEQLAANPSDTARDQLLCAIAGLGVVASVALPTLMNMLRTSCGDKKLTALAIRSVGGVDAVDELLKVLESETSTETAKATAAYGIGVLADRVEGFTVVLCASLGHGTAAGTSRREPLSLIRLRRDDRDDSASVDSSVVPVATRPKKPNFAPTHVVVDSSIALRALQQYFGSALPNASPGLYPTLRNACEVLSAGISVIPHVSAQDAASLSKLVGQLSALPGVATPRYLDGAYELTKAPADFGDKIMTHITRFLSKSTPSVVTEKLLLAAAELPVVWSAPYLPAILRLANGRLAHDVSTLAAASHLIGRTLQRPAKGARSNRPAEAEEAAVDLLARLIATSRHIQVVLGALAGARLAGDAAAAVVPVTFERWLNETEPEVAEACVACLACVGGDGVARLNQVLADQSFHIDVRRLATAGLVTAAGISNASVVSTIISQLEAVIVSESSNEELLVAVIPAFARVALRPKAVMVTGNDDATVLAGRSPKLPKLQVLCSVMEDERAYSLGSRFAAAEAIACSGGVVGEQYLTQTLLKHPHSAARALAANVLVHSGGSPVMALLHGINDSQQQVREEALESLRCISLPVIVNTLRGPQRDRLTVAHRCTVDFLRFQYDDLIDALREELSLDVVQRATETHHSVRDPTPTASTVASASTDSIDTDGVVMQ